MAKMKNVKFQGNTLVEVIVATVLILISFSLFVTAYARVMEFVSKRMNIDILFDAKEVYLHATMNQSVYPKNYSISKTQGIYNHKESIKIVISKQRQTSDTICVLYDLTNGKGYLNKFQ